MIEGTQYIDSGKAASLGFRGSFIVLPVDGVLASEWDQVNNRLTSEVPELKDTMITPPPHTTLCWLAETEQGDFLPTVESWVSQNTPVLLQNRLHLGRFSNIPRLPYIGIRNSHELKRKRQLLAVELAVNFPSVVEEDQPHLSLFYVQDPEKWLLIKGKIKRLIASISIPLISASLATIDLVTFLSDGSQKVTRVSK